MKLIKVLSFFVVFLTVWEYSKWTCVGIECPGYVLDGLIPKPFVYRALVPFLAKVMALLNINGILAIRILVVLSAIFFFISFAYLISIYTYNKNKIFFYSLIATELFMLIFFHQTKYYDFATAAFFSLLLALLIKNKMRLYYLLFLVSCLNRETTILLLFIYIVYQFRNYMLHRITFVDYANGLIYQISAYLLIRILLMAIYINNPGSYLYTPLWNINIFVDNPMKSVVHWLLFIIIIVLVVNRWKEKSWYLRVSFLILFPIIFVSYIFMGIAFEVRVFAEIYPVTFILTIWRFLA